MNIASIAKTKNTLSQLLQRVKQGETIVITDRKRPVARLQPMDKSDLMEDLPSLYAAGILLPPAGGALDPASFLAAARPRLAGKASLTSAVLEDREEDR
ncbi:MAG: type II toxin-antitoxin system prevent-host-death family antitoxin [Verrucomicrobia bacterium]|nr:type II toxin-antitoxin system prevent-host-death family antitoxin [Verrucomicrobiota bacterium]